MQRSIKLSKAFMKAAEKYFVFKFSVEEERHSLEKLNTVYQLSKKISKLKSFPGKIVSYRGSKGLQYFIYQQHAVFFKLSEETMELKYFVAAKRIKKTL